MANQLIKRYISTEIENGEKIEIIFEVAVFAEDEKFAYEDVKVNLYSNGKFICEISKYLDAANLLIDMVDSIDWGLILRSANQ